MVFLYGIFGVPSGLTGKDLAAALTKRIHLGLDLQGGAHLMLQVEVKEAVNAETDNTVASVQQDLKAANLGFSQVYKPDPLKPDETGKPELIRDRRRNASQSAARCARCSTRSTPTSTTSTAAATARFTLTMKPLIEKDLDEKTVQQAIETIRDRVDSLGVSEPLIQEYNLGANQILVELPGISDLDRVKSIIQSTARLEIHAVVGDRHGFADEQSALASVGGALPPDDELAHGIGIWRPAQNDQRLHAAARGHCGRQRLPLRRSRHQSQHRAAHREVHPYR